jgi:hypothetical protein
MRLDTDKPIDAYALGQSKGIHGPLIATALEQLRGRALIAGDAKDVTLTRAGCQVLAKLVAARRVRLEELIGEWAPEKRDEVAALFARMARELVPDAPRLRTE